MSRDDATLADIARAVQLVLVFTQGMNSDDFLSDLKTQSAVLHQLMVIGEAVKRLSPEFRSSHAAIPWTLVAGMRDRLIHGYDVVDLDQVWTTVIRDLPTLVVQLQALLPDDNA